MVSTLCVFGIFGVTVLPVVWEHGGGRRVGAKNEGSTGKNNPETDGSSREKRNSPTRGNPYRSGNIAAVSYFLLI